MGRTEFLTETDCERALVGRAKAKASTRAKWRSSSSACRRVLEKCLTPPTLLEMAMFQQQLFLNTVCTVWTTVRQSHYPETKENSESRGHGCDLRHGRIRYMRKHARLLLLLTIVAVSGFAQTLPAFKHVFIVLEENGNYSTVIGKATMPYLNSLANKYGLATQYYANGFGSRPNYFMLTMGQFITGSVGTVTADNVVRHLLTAGKTWKGYEESLPHEGYVEPDVGLYARRHCPSSGCRHCNGRQRCAPLANRGQNLESIRGESAA